MEGKLGDRQWILATLVSRSKRCSSPQIGRRKGRRGGEERRLHSVLVMGGSGREARRSDAAAGRARVA
ncbi:hypothetical protein E2562_021631 [Oryza meyeriana var. granulata]|uniref:Uncharacterized protein n=1 Tax=Oryza meyeriana var. granulata TaxID=110450 RepID=A0A6G1DZF9_9ORYZ|nr:hypothetical protein E2562_021631 [Oryza meyeriana var. granulata]